MPKALTGDDRYEEIFPALQEVTENAGGISKNCKKSFPASQLCKIKIMTGCGFCVTLNILECSYNICTNKKDGT